MADAELIDSASDASSSSESLRIANLLQISIFLLSFLDFSVFEILLGRDPRNPALSALLRYFIILRVSGLGKKLLTSGALKLKVPPSDVEVSISSLLPKQFFVAGMTPAIAGPSNILPECVC